MTTITPALRPAVHTEVSPPTPRQSRPRTPVKRALIAGLVAVGLAAGAVGVYDRVGRPGPSEAAEPVTTGRAVTATGSMAVTGGTELLLPAQAMPNQQTTLHPRVDGYVSKWHADRGAQVTAGQLLAEIAAPELDQQAGQAEAALERGRAAVVQLKAEGEQAVAESEAAAALVQHAGADAKLAERDLDRISNIPAMSQSERDTAVRNRAAATARVAATKADASAKEKLVAVRAAAVTAQEANVRALVADLARLKELQGFKRVVAPFAGTITRRHAEVGMRVAATSGGPLFDLQDASVLRVQVDVPQRYAAAVRLAVAAEVLIPERPDRPLAATLARTADALDPTTRTLRVELDLPNPDGAVLAGTFARARLRVSGERPAVAVPVAALQYTPDGIRVAVIAGGVVELRVVTLGRDYGRTVEVLTGLIGTERLVANPPDDLRDGEPVRVVAERPVGECR